ncbi:hypothetical protein L596_019932 [Steinernema carpocapsae]|uniref:Uncharacterized protein n=1 Tax=Steinernema carpocapsae TaxID=34508 RepID=A0A4U5MS86_STECR|nr:hypothetical protein L596_019932 [Steinernema carpocapsae]
MDTSPLNLAPVLKMAIQDYHQENFVPDLPQDGGRPEPQPMDPGTVGWAEGIRQIERVIREFTTRLTTWNTAESLRQEYMMAEMRHIATEVTANRHEIQRVQDFVRVVQSQLAYISQHWPDTNHIKTHFPYQAMCSFCQAHQAHIAQYHSNDPAYLHMVYGPQVQAAYGPAYQVWFQHHVQDPAPSNQAAADNAAAYQDPGQPAGNEDEDDNQSMVIMDEARIETPSFLGGEESHSNSPTSTYHLGF